VRAENRRGDAGDEQAEESEMVGSPALLSASLYVPQKYMVRQGFT
jgi:hypothetical protein